MPLIKIHLQNSRHHEIWSVEIDEKEIHYVTQLLFFTPKDKISPFRKFNRECSNLVSWFIWYKIGQFWLWTWIDALEISRICNAIEIFSINEKYHDFFREIKVDNTDYLDYACKFIEKQSIEWYKEQIKFYLED